MTHRHDVVVAPVHVICDKCRLLIDFVCRVTFYWPASIKFTGASICCPQCGHTVT